MKISFGLMSSRGCELRIRTKTIFVQHLLQSAHYRMVQSISIDQRWAVLETEQAFTWIHVSRGTMHSFISCSWHTKRYTQRSLPANQWTGGVEAHTADKSQNDLLNLDCHTFLLIKGRHGLCSIIVVLYPRQTEAASLRPRNDCHNWWLWYTSQK